MKSQALLLLLCLNHVPSLFVTGWTTEPLIRQAAPATNNAVESHILESEQRFNRYLPASKGIADVERDGFLKLNRWRSGVELFETRRRGERVLLARTSKVGRVLSLDTVDPFLEPVDAGAKALELALFFESGVVLIRRADVLALVDGAKIPGATHGIPPDEESLAPSVTYDADKRQYSVRFVLAEDRRILLVRATISPGGAATREVVSLLDGPPVRGGWDAPGPDLDEYVKQLREFDAIVDPLLGKVALQLVRDANLNQQGWWPARVQALEWLLRKPAIRKDFSQELVEAIQAGVFEGPVRDRALIVLQSTGKIPQTRP